MIYSGTANTKPAWQASSPSDVDAAKVSNLREAQRSQERVS